MLSIVVQAAAGACASTALATHAKLAIGLHDLRLALVVGVLLCAFAWSVIAPLAWGAIKPCLHGDTQSYFDNRWETGILAGVEQHCTTEPRPPLSLHCSTQQHHRS